MSDDLRGSDQPGPVIVLGAGFSKALSEAMPLTDELGDAIRDGLSGDDQVHSPLGRFSGTGASEGALEASRSEATWLC
jgi:hypothetical protein